MTVTLLSSHLVFGTAEDMLQAVLGLSVSDSTCWRVSGKIADQVPDHQVSSPGAGLGQALQDSAKTVYGSVDGSMLLTEQGWKEVKLGRVMEVESRRDEDGELRWSVSNSEYVGTIGCEDFRTGFEQLFPPDSPCMMIMLSDGATWIHTWQKDKYPDAVLILDIFHVLEKLSEAGKHAENPKKWLDRQHRRLLGGHFSRVCTDIQGLDMPEKEKQGLLSYLYNNRDRMHYKEYLAKGYMIGSGCIESAHRSVLQERMKLSGQRWSMGGCAKMVKLRAIYKSGKEHLITQTFKKAA